MASTILDPLADDVVDALNAVSVTPALKAYKWDPGFAGLSKLPAAVVYPPRIDRTETLQPEGEIGSEDWLVTFDVVLFFDLAKSQTTAGRAVEYVEAFIRVIDGDHMQEADALVDDAKVTDAEPVLDLSDQARPILRYDCTLQVARRVADA